MMILRTTTLTCRRTDAKGFTLVELLLVCVIMGVLLGATVPAFRAAFCQAALRRAAFDLRTTLEHARTQSSCREQACQVQIDCMRGIINTVELSSPEDLLMNQGSGRCLGTRRLLGDVIVDSNTFATQSGVFKVTFYPDGSADEGEIRLRVPDGGWNETYSRFILSIDGTSGTMSFIDS